MRKPLIGALVALSALIGLLAGCGDGRLPESPPQAERPQFAIVGSWRPTSIPGYTPPAQFPDAFADAPISFDQQHRLWGSDGCNDFDVTYQVGRDGSFSSASGSMTAIGCANVPNGEVTGRARRVEVDGVQLTFLDAGGAVLGRYQRIAALGRPDVGPSPLATALVGTWRPLRITGYRVPAPYPDALTYAAVTFGAGSWRASDGCNITTGSYTLGSGGRISVTAGPTTEIGCANVPNAVVLSRAASVQVTGDRLTVRSTAGGVLATYQRVR